MEKFPMEKLEKGGNQNMSEDIKPNTITSVRTPVLEITYEEKGSPEAPPIVLLHGFPDDARSWDTVSEELASAGYRTLAPYLRGFGPTRFLSDDVPRSGQLAALAQDVLEFTDALGLEEFVLVGHDWGARAAQSVAALHPERVQRLVSFTDYEISWDEEGFPPYEVLHALWYQWVLMSEMGPPLLQYDRRGFCRYLWKAWSPTWDFSDEEFQRTAASFDNPDFVDVVLSGYRHGRHEEAPGDPRYEELEQKLAEGPDITVPTTLLLGSDDGILQPFPGDERWREHFTGEASKRLVEGVGHFPHRERPDAVVEAVLAPLPGE